MRATRAAVDGGPWVARTRTVAVAGMARYTRTAYARGWPRGTRDP